MTSFLEIDAADERHARLASRKGVVTAQQRVAQQFGNFIAIQGREGLAYLKEEIEGIVLQASKEFGTDPKATYDSVIDYFESQLKTEATTKEASVHESRKPKMCPFHRDVVDISLAEGSAKAGFDAMAQHWGGPRHCDGEGYEGSKCNFKPKMVTQSWWDERAEKAEERKQQRAEQAELEAQQGDEITEPVAEGDEIIESLDTGDTLIEEPVAEDNVVDVDFGGGEEQSAEVPMSMAASTKEANQYIKKQGDKWVITQKGTGKVLSHHDSEEEAEASFRAMMANKHGSTYTVNLKGQNNFTASIPVEANDEWDARQQAIRQSVAAGNPPAWIDSVSEAPLNRVATETTGLGEANPKIDKRLWTPETVPFLDVDDDDGRWPTRHKDIVEPIKPNNGDKLTEIGEKTTERVKLDTADDNSGFASGGESTSGPTKTWTTGPSTAVSSVRDDAHKNPITELVREGYDGFLPEAEVQQAIASHRS